MNPATDWVDQARGLLDMVKQGLAARAAAQGGTDEDRHGGDCRWCPICQAAAVARGERPEVSAALADVLTAAGAALRSFAEEGRPATSDAGDPSAAPFKPAGPADPPPVLQRIDIA